MTDLKLAVVTGLFSLGGVVFGALLMPLTQLYLETKREQRAAHRAKLLVAGELLHAQMTLRSVSESGHWPPIEDLDGGLPTSAWRENRSTIAGMVSEDLWVRMIVAYRLLENDRARFAIANRSPATTALTTEVAKSMKEESDKLGRLRRELGVGGGWLDEIEVKQQES